MHSFEFRAPSSIDETLNLLAELGDEAKLLAGGTGLVNLMKQRLAQPAILIGLQRVQGLNSIAVQDGSLRLGALATQREVETSPTVASFSSLLPQTYRHVATVRIRNAATVGGGVVHGDPSQDPPPSLIALDARMELRNRKGSRTVQADAFFKDYYETDVAPDELVTAVVVPPQPSGSRTAFIKFLPRTADDYATVSVAVRLDIADGVIRDARVALGAAGSTVIRARSAENVLRGQRATVEAFRAAGAAAKDEVDPATDTRGSAGYKREMAEVWVRRALEQAMGTGVHS